MKTCFNYFVSYYYRMNDEVGFGNGRVTTEDEVNDYKSIQDMIQIICKDNHYDDVIVLFWRKLK